MDLPIKWSHFIESRDKKYLVYVKMNWDLAPEQLDYKLNILESNLWEREREREREINQRFIETNEIQLWTTGLLYKH